jgi:3-deoxy-D-manno-octulosonic-acid transferase
MGYRALTVLASPLLLLYLALRVARDRRYARGLAERLGRLPRSFRQTAPGAIWLHAVSVGEVLTAVPLLKRLKEALPWAPVYLSVTTLAGRAMAGEKLAGLVAGVFYAPLDLTFALRAVLRALRPVLVVVMETEIWPNLYREAQRSGAQLVLLNARISDRAMPAYRRWRWLFQAPLSRPDRILVQDERAAARYRELGAARVEVAGNLKYDFDPEAAQIAPDLAAWLERLHASPVWIAASTMPPERAGDPDEDDLVVETILRLRDALPRLLLIWAPRKPERFDAAAERLQRAGVAFVRRSRWQGEAALALPGVLLVDTIGELAALYRVGDAVFMGGTFPHRGGHNPLEPAAFGVPVVAGPHMENFAEIAADFDAQDAWIRVSSADRLAAVLAELLGDAARRAALGQRALALAGARRGASVRAVEALRASYEDALSRPLPVLWKRLLLVPLTLVWRAGLSLDRAIESTRAPNARVSRGERWQPQSRRHGQNAVRDLVVRATEAAWLAPRRAAARLPAQRRPGDAHRRARRHGYGRSRGRRSADSSACRAGRRRRGRGPGAGARRITGRPGLRLRSARRRFPALASAARLRHRADRRAGPVLWRRAAAGSFARAVFRVEEGRCRGPHADHRRPLLCRSRARNPPLERRRAGVFRAHHDRGIGSAARGRGRILRVGQSWLVPGDAGAGRRAVRILCGLSRSSSLPPARGAGVARARAGVGDDGEGLAEPAGGVSDGRAHPRAADSHRGR